MRRAACLVPLLGTVVSIGGASAAASPDLAVPASGLRRIPTGLEATVINQGSAASAAATVRAQDAPPLLERGIGHEILPGERAAVFSSERGADGRLYLVLTWSAPRPADHVHGSIALVGGAFAAPPVGASIEVRSESATRLDLETGVVPSGVLRLAVEPTATDRPVALDLSGVEITGRHRPREIWFGHRWLSPGSGDGDDDGPDSGDADPPVLFDLVPHSPSEPAWRAEALLPPLAAGASARVRFPDPPVGRPLFVTVDPDALLAEEREGNNTATVEPPGRGPLAALHVHTSFSEGRASFDFQARALGESGYGLAWITDHDWRLRLLGFAAASPEGGGWPGRGRLEAGEWDVPEAVTRPPLTGTPADHAAAVSGLVLEMPAGGTSGGRPGPREQTVACREPRNTHLLPLAAEVRLRLRFDSARLPAGTALLVRLTLSDHPGERRRLTYLVGPTLDGARGLYLQGEKSRVLALPAGRPALLEFDVSADARASWPGPLDDHLHQIEVGLRRSGQQAASIRLLEIRTHTGEGSQTLFAAARRLAEGYPNLALSIGSELSHPYPHFNAFTPELPVLDYPALRTRDAYAAAAVRQTRALGGLVSFNHPFGALLRYEPEFLDHLLRERFYDADLLEVGYRRRGGRSLEDHLALWDRAGAAPVILTGVGVTDSHGEGPGIGWFADENNLATRLHSSGVEEAARDLAAGRVSIEDPLAFSGTLHLEAEGGFREGNVVVVDANGRHLPAFTLTGSGLPSGARVDLLVGGERTASLTLTGPELRHEFGAGRVAGPVRAELRDAAGAPLILTNPIYLVAADALPAAGLDAERAGLSFPSFSLARGRGFRIESVVARAGVPAFGRDAIEVRIEAAAGGEFPIHWRSDGATGEVTATGEDGRMIPARSVADSGEVRIGPFATSGRVRVIVRPAAGSASWIRGVLLLGAALGLVLALLARLRARRGSPLSP